MAIIDFEEQKTTGARIVVVGVGGGGSNAVETMIKSGMVGVEFLVCNTDKQALAANTSPARLQIGAKLTSGLGAGANPDVGRAAALEDRDRIAETLEGADMVFVTAGMGGGTGTGGAPVVASIARELGALTVGVVTKPFMFEGKKRARQARQGLSDLRENVDTLITIPNQRLLYIAGDKTTMLEAFHKADEVLLHAVQGITDLINLRGLINLDFADVRTVMSNGGMALMGTGRARGEGRAIDAAMSAISSPLLEDLDIKGARGMLINFTGGPDMSLYEVNEAATYITDQAEEDAEIIFGAVIDENLSDEVRVTVIATGFKSKGDEPFTKKVDEPTREETPVTTTRFNFESKVETKMEAATVTEPGTLVVEKEEVFEVATPATAEEPTAVRAIEEILTEEASPAREHRDSPDLLTARRIARELGVGPLSDEELDIPTFIRRQPDRR
jgi:cell division protein FtsZ